MHLNLKIEFQSEHLQYEEICGRVKEEEDCILFDAHRKSQISWWLKAIQSMLSPAKNRMSLHRIFIIFSWLSFSSSLQKRWWWWHLYDKIHDYNYIWHIQEQRSIWEHNVWSKPGDHILNSKIRKWMMTNFFFLRGRVRCGDREKEGD